ncbi:MAG: zinc ABC transporter substrate-binding protein [Firmicutes bacterium]|nr:zinc ABC transporter substrate-binding protein [Bacillota bacterium]
MNNKKRFKYFSKVIAVILSAVFIFVGCGANEETAEQTGPEIIATNFPGYDFARKIVGDKGNVRLLLPPGAESHAYEPSPKDIIALTEADLLICVGGESESWLKDVLSNLENSKLSVVSMMEVVPVMEEEALPGLDEDHDHSHENSHDHDHEEGHEQKGIYDEHVWTSPENAVLIAESIAENLCEIAPEHAESFNTQKEELVAELKVLSEDFRELVEGAERNVLVFADRFPFLYLVREYGLSYYAAFPGCASETEPNVAVVTFLIDMVKEKNIPAVFYIEFSNQKMADTICEAAGVQKVQLHSCHNVSAEDFESGKTYVDLMRENIESLKIALY